MGVFPILGVKSEDQWQTKLRCLARGGLTEQDRMVSVDHIQLERGQQLIHKGRDRDSGRNISMGERKAGVTEDKRFRILITAVGLCENEYVVTMLHQVFTKRGNRAYNPVDNRVVEVSEKCDVQGFTPWFC